MTDDQRLPFGSDDLGLPDALRGPLRAQLDALRDRYGRHGGGGPVGFGKRPGLVVIDPFRAHRGFPRRQRPRDGFPKGARGEANHVRDLDAVALWIARGSSSGPSA